MSFVSVVGRENFITIVSDGLVINSETGEEIDQRYRKFHKISDNQFVAYTGNQAIAEQIKKVLPYRKNPYNLKDISEEIHKIILKEIDHNKAKITLSIGGLNTEGEIELYSFNNNPKEKLYSYNPKGSDISYFFLTSDHIEDIDLESHLQGYLQQTGLNTANKIIKAQKKMNDFVAGNDPSVNKVTFELIIRKP